MIVVVFFNFDDNLFQVYLFRLVGRSSFVSCQRRFIGNSWYALGSSLTASNNFATANSTSRSITLFSSSCEFFLSRKITHSMPYVLRKRFKHVWLIAIKFCAIMQQNWSGQFFCLVKYSVSTKKNFNIIVRQV